MTKTHLYSTKYTTRPQHRDSINANVASSTRQPVGSADCKLPVSEVYQNSSPP